MTLDEGIRQLAKREGPFTSDDLIELVGVPDESHTANSRNSSIGSAFRRAHKQGIIQPTGNTALSRQPHRKSGLIREWVGA